MAAAQSRRAFTPALLPACAGIASVLFLLSAAGGVWAAYDRTAAALRFGLFLIGIGICGGLWAAGRQGLSTVFTVTGCYASALAVGLGISALFVPSAQPPMAGVLALFVPLQAAYAVKVLREGARALGGFLAGSTALAVLMLAWTGERSAWLAVALGCLGAMAAGRRYGAWLLWPVTGTLAGVYAFLLLMPVQSPLVQTAGLADRLALWRDLAQLAGDYRFTGSGLGMTAMTASTYLFLLHVPFTYQAHHLWLQIMLEQGIVGVIGFGGMVAAALVMAARLAAHDDVRLRILARGTLGACVVLTVHGLLDSELYASPLMPLSLLPLGLVYGLYAWARTQLWQESEQRPAWQRHLPAAAVVAALVAAILVWRALGGSAAWAANLGAVAQTRAELSLYHWPAWSFQDQVRRDGRVDLAPAQHFYALALARDPTNQTVNRRLGQIALSRGQYDLAHRYLLAAYAADPSDRVVRQLLGECAALAGDLPGAVAFWRDLDLRHGQLMVRQGWYTALGNDQDLYHMEEAIHLYERAIHLP